MIAVEGTSSVWVNLKGYVLKCSPELVRHANSEEETAYEHIIGSELWDGDKKLLEKIKGQTDVKCEDITEVADRPYTDVDIPAEGEPQPIRIDMLGGQGQYVNMFSAQG